MLARYLAAFPLLTLAVACDAPPQQETDVAAVAAPLALPGVSSIAAGGLHTCAVDDGAVKCWGSHGLGTLGIGWWLGTPPGCREDGNGIVCDGATEVPGLGAGMRQVVSGFAFSCALSDAGEVSCWGSNLYGQLGIGQGTPNGCADGGPMVGTYCASPQPVTGLTGVVELAANDFSTCARTASGSVSCWGLNLHGQLGIGTSHPAQCTGSTAQGFAMQCWRPVTVPGLSGVSEVAAGGGYHTCAIANGVTYCWGMNGEGELGIGKTLPAGCLDLDGDGIASVCPSPQRVLNLSGARELALGGVHTCARLADGTMRCWGSNVWGQLGMGQPSGITSCEEDGHGNGILDICRWPVAVKNLTGVARVSAGWTRSCAVKSDGSARCWGSNDRKALGIGTLLPAVCSEYSGFTICPEPVSVLGLIGPAGETSNNELHTCASIQGGGAMCWGTNGSGNLGVTGAYPGCVDNNGDGIPEYCTRAAPVDGL